MRWRKSWTGSTRFHHISSSGGSRITPSTSQRRIACPSINAPTYTGTVQARTAYSPFSPHGRPVLIPHRANREAQMDGPNSMIIWSYEPNRRLPYKSHLLEPRQQGGTVRGRTRTIPSFRSFGRRSRPARSGTARATGLRAGTVGVPRRDPQTSVNFRSLWRERRLGTT
jgi:hypothetical protein